jgi:beta-barrel assembly-enhancing protease
MHSDPHGADPHRADLPKAALQTAKPVAFPARFSDGLTAATEPVTATFTAAGLEITKSGVLTAFRSRVWAYPGLRAAASLTGKAPDVLLSSPVDPGCSLFVDDPDFVRMLAARAPHLNARTDRLRTAAPWLALSAVVLGGVGWLWAADISPARLIAGLIPDGARETMGKRVVSTMSDNRRVCSTTAGDAALAKLTNRLSQAANAKFSVVVVDWSLLNAFAAPGEQILLTRELVQNARSADEVAAVLAHEMGHGLERHPETGVVRMIGMSAALELVTGGSGGALSNVGLLLAQLSYTRVAEQQADDHSYRILRIAGIPATGFRDFFKRAGELEDKSSVAKSIGQYDILRTHPQSAERVKRALAQPTYPTTPALDDTDWQALKDICGPRKVPPSPKPSSKP